jgi:hypothetical protein
VTDATATAAIVAVGSALTIVAQLYRESRNRTWDAEDRDRREAAALKAAQKHAAEIADHLGQKVENTAALLATTVAEAAARTDIAAAARTNRVLTQIAENTELSVKAFTEANNVNEKIASIGLGLKDGRALSPSDQKPNS